MSTGFFCCTSVVLSQVLHTVLHFCIPYLYSRNREKFRNSKFPNFQTMVAGLRNSTAVHEVLILLYRIPVLPLYYYKLYCFCISNLYFIREIERNSEIRNSQTSRHGRRSPEQYSSTCSSHIILNTSTVLLLYYYKLYCFVLRICTLFEKSREIQKFEIPKLPDHGRRSTEQYSTALYCILYCNSVF